ncbi:MAG: hypothetical protein ACTTG9_02340 [Dialister pneumosintes]
MIYFNGDAYKAYLNNELYEWGEAYKGNGGGSGGTTPPEPPKPPEEEFIFSKRYDYEESNPEGIYTFIVPKSGQHKIEVSGGAGKDITGKPVNGELVVDVQRLEIGDSHEIKIGKQSEGRRTDGNTSRFAYRVIASGGKGSTLWGSTYDGSDSNGYVIITYLADE